MPVIWVNIDALTRLGATGPRIMCGMQWIMPATKPAEDFVIATGVQVCPWAPVQLRVRGGGHWGDVPAGLKSRA